MRIKIFSSTKPWELEDKVNNFIDGMQVIDIKLSTSIYGDSSDMNNSYTCLVMYK